MENGTHVRLNILNGRTYQQQPCAHWSWLVESRQMEFASTVRVQRCRKCCKLEGDKKWHEENTIQLWSRLFTVSLQTKQIHHQFSNQTKSARINYCLSLLWGGAAKKRRRSKIKPSYLMSFSEKIGAGSHNEPGVTQRNWFANAARLIKISYSSWRVRLILEIVVSALSDPFLTHLLLIQDRERWITRKQTMRPFIKMDFFFSFCKGEEKPDGQNKLDDPEEQKGVHWDLLDLKYHLSCQ